MPDHTIDFSSEVEAERKQRVEDARMAFEACLVWVVDAERETALHEVERGLVPRLMALGCAFIAVWVAVRGQVLAPRTITHGQASYRLRGRRDGILRTRFGDLRFPRPLYELVHGRGPATMAPQDRVLGLACGRMTLGVHFTAAYLAAKMAFDQVTDVMRQFGGYVPSKRTILGIVDKLGPQAVTLMKNMPVPEGDGEILVIQNDDKGAAMIGKREHARRCRPHKKRGKGATRGGRRRKRLANPQPRRGKGKKSKNARMAKVFVIYTLRRGPDGALEGPLNKRVIATFGSRRDAFVAALQEATRRGYGTKPTYFLADGARAIWKLQGEYFPLATACVDWYHVCEYLWLAGGTTHAEGSAELAEWVRERKAELLSGDIDGALVALHALGGSIGRSGPGTKGRRQRLRRAIRYLEGHRERLRYEELARADMDIATGAVEGAVNHVVGMRLDGSMMRWSPARANNLLALRCAVVNGLWTALEECIAEIHSRSRDPVIGRITPQAPQEPYDAVRKAA